MEEGEKEGLLVALVGTCSYINLGCLAESSHGVDMVIEDDDTNHHPHAEHQSFLTRKPTPVLPAREKRWQCWYCLVRTHSFQASQLKNLDSSNPSWETNPDLQQPG